MRRPLAVMLSPAVSLLGLFVFAPMTLTIWLAFQEWSTETGFDEARFVGLDNFLAIFGSTSVGRDFKGALVNTAVSMVLQEYVAKYPKPDDAKKHLDEAIVTYDHFKEAAKKVRSSRDSKPMEKVAVPYYR